MIRGDLAFLLFIVCTRLSFIAAACNGRGSKVNGNCVCHNTRPAQGMVGSTGGECEIDVYRADLNGDDIASKCSAQGCNTLSGKKWVCFYAGLDWNSTSNPWRYLSVQLNRTSNYGDPDLYGLFDEAGDKGAKPTNSSYSYHFRDTSSGSYSSVVKTVKKSSFHSKTYDGVYLCVKDYSSYKIGFSLRAFTSDCPSSFTDEGEEMVCSTAKSSSQKRHTGCNPDGTCQCVEPYKKPIISTYSGLGFDDCSARLTKIPDEDFGTNNTYTVWNVKGNPGYDYYSFNVEYSDYQVVVHLSGQPSAHCYAISREAHLKYGQPPGWRWGQYDFRPTYNYGKDRRELELVFDRSMAHYHTGHWYLGFDGDDRTPCNYSLRISKYECPSNCTNQGQCVHLMNGTNYCDCDEGYFGVACSQHASSLTYGQPVSTQQKMFEYEYYQLPSSESLTSTVEVRISCSFHSYYYSHWTSARPELLLLKGDDDSYPTFENATLRVVMEEQNTTYHTDLCPSQLKQGTWRAAVYNPRREYTLAYTVAITKQGACLNNCSGHGSCTDNGLCACEGSWSGGDCSVDSSGHLCLEGSRRAVQRAEQSGTCWQECSCQSGGSCAYQESCVDFTCNSANHRRKGSEDRCVEDGCKQDAWEETSEHSCLRKCVCPSDGSACHLDSGCDPNNFSCKQGHKRFSDKSARCFPTGCDQGSLAVSSATVENGLGYGTCTCGGQEREGQAHCKVEETDSHSLSIVCNQGYSLTGASKDSGSGHFLGGQCVVSKPGTAAWGVVLYTLLGMLVGGGVSLAGLYYYENQFKHRPSERSYYQELSTGTSF